MATSIPAASLAEQMDAAPYGAMVIIETTAKGAMVKALKLESNYWLLVSGLQGKTLWASAVQEWADKVEATWPARIITPDLGA